ncbi:protein boule-like [Colossoma macropomum]|uniref:protein boule-like n=1 Tax=Colossoma macropomum TaxID=42526 RepID=UPI001864C91F|nr:protein boule-like [Colossoma macropomum]
MESETGTQTSSPSTSPAPAELTNALHQSHPFGTVIPNRIFVGGIDVKTNENDLRHFFSQYGTIKEVKIVIDRAGISKGYGFVTFETQEDAQKILHDADRLCRDKRLNIGQAIRRQQVGGHCNYNMASPSPSLAVPSTFSTMYLTTPTGYPYTYHNGVAYFHTPEPNTHMSHWPTPHPMSGSPVMVTHSTSFCTPHQCQYRPCDHFFKNITSCSNWFFLCLSVSQASSQYVSGHVPWTVPQVESPVPVSPSPFLYIQPAELMYQPMEMPADNGCVQSAMPVVEASVPEHEQKFHQVRRGFSHLPVHMKPRYCRGPHYTHLRKNYRPELAHVPPAPASSPAQEVLK